MERDLTGYTKSSTSESLSSCGDLSLEDHGSLSSASRVSLETSISYLTKHQNFIYFNSKGSKQPSFVYFTESLNILHIFTEKSHNKKIYTTDILDFSSGISITIKKMNEIIHPINIRTRNKNLVLGCKSSTDRDFWYSCASLLLKHAKECYSSVGLRKYCDSIIKNQENEEEIIKIRDLQYHE